jgi:hypothetical protein
VQSRGLERQVLNEMWELDTQTVSVQATVVSSRPDRSRHLKRSDQAADRRADRDADRPDGGI